MIALVHNSSSSSTQSFINLEHHVPSARILRNKAGMNKTQKTGYGGQYHCMTLNGHLLYSKSKQSPYTRNSSCSWKKWMSSSTLLLLLARIPKVLSQMYCLEKGWFGKSNPQGSLKNPEGKKRIHTRFSCLFSPNTHTNPCQATVL